jgi:hypothetical protein
LPEIGKNLSKSIKIPYYLLMAQNHRKGVTKMKTMILYFIALTGILLASWHIQDIHRGWGYTLGVLGLLVAFFVAVNSLTTGRRK